MVFNERLRQLREGRELTQTDVAKAIGVSDRVYGYYESSRFPKDETVLKNIANFFNVTVDYLVGKTNRKDAFIYTGEIVNTIFNWKKIKERRKKARQAKQSHKAQMIKTFGKTRYYLSILFGRWILYVGRY